MEGYKRKKKKKKKKKKEKKKKKNGGRPFLQNTSGGAPQGPDYGKTIIYREL